MAFDYFEPDTLAEAVALAERYAGEASFLAGGTDLVIQMWRRLRRPRQVIALQRLQPLAGIAVDDGRVSLGALATHRSIERHPAFSTGLRALVESAEVIGGHQVRNVGTVGGNICNASPAADLAPILLVLDAEVHLCGTRGARTCRLGDFLQGPGRTAREPDEILTRVTFASPGERAATAFIKLGRRRAMEISVVSVAALVAFGEDGRCTDARIAVGAAAPTAIRLPQAEALLHGDGIHGPILTEAGRAAAAACAPLSDVRASAEYRRHLIEVAVPRAVRLCVERLGGVGR